MEAKGSRMAAGTDRSHKHVFRLVHAAGVLTLLAACHDAKPLILASCLGLSVVTALVTYVVTERWVAYPLYIGIMGLFSMRMSPLQALLTALVPGRLRGTLMSLTIATGQVGTGLGASLAGMTYAGWGYRATTWFSAVTILLMAALVWGYLPEPGSPDAEESRDEVAAHVAEA